MAVITTGAKTREHGWFLRTAEIPLYDIVPHIPCDCHENETRCCHTCSAVPGFLKKKLDDFLFIISNSKTIHTEINIS